MKAKQEIAALIDVFLSFICPRIDGKFSADVKRFAWCLVLLLIVVALAISGDGFGLEAIRDVLATDAANIESQDRKEDAFDMRFAAEGGHHDFCPEIDLLDCYPH